MRIDEIVIGERIRKEIRNIDQLAASIAEDGMLHPVVVNGNGVLVAGRRRIEAARQLGWTTVPVNVVETLQEAADLIRAERQENVCREDFTMTEIAAAAERMLDILKPAAEKRRADPGAGRGRPKKACGNLPQANGTPAPKSRDQAAAAFGKSGRTVEKAIAVKKAADESPELFGEIAKFMDDTGNADRAFKRVQQIRDERKRQEIAKTVRLSQSDPVRHGDFRQVLSDIGAGTVRLVLTDPPYDKNAIPLYGDLAAFAAEKLCDGGSLLCYCGQYALPEIFPLMTKHLKYQWCIAVRHAGGRRRQHGWRVAVAWKPMLWFVKGTYKGEYIHDLLDSEPGDKSKHPWAQGMWESVELVQKLTTNGELVVDPFAGSGTNLIAARQLGRQIAGADVAIEHVATANNALKEFGASA